jgi:predicted lipoprotein with Yx(FWY)xxD motif
MRSSGVGRLVRSRGGRRGGWAAAVLVVGLIAVLGLFPAVGNAGSTIGGKGPTTVAKSLTVKGRTLLTTLKGYTLYALSSERNGKFNCTAANTCTTLWHPLTIAPKVVPKGPVKLGKIRRPEGQYQVTYHGLPLYRFGDDKKPGDAEGDGLEGVGVWRAVVVPAKSSH